MKSTIDHRESNDKLSPPLPANDQLHTTGPAASQVPHKTSSTISYYAAFVSLGLIASSLGPTLLRLADNTQTQVSEISFLFTARSLGYMLGSLLGGRLYDRLSGHVVMGISLLVMAGMMILAPLMSMLWLLTVILLLAGVGEGTLDVGGNTLLVWLHRYNVGPYMNALHFFFGVGAFLGPVIIAQATLRSGDIRWAYWILAILVLPSATWLLRLPSPSIRQPSEDDTPEQVDYVLLILLTGFFFLFVGAEVGFGGWISTYAVTMELTNEATAAYLTSAFWGALTIGRLLAIPITARLRPRIVLFTDLFGCLFSITLILLWPKSLIVLWVGSFGFGLSMASIFPVTLSLAERRITITGRVTGTFLVGASLGGMTIPWIIGQLFAPIGPWMMTVVLVINLILAIALFVVLLLYSGDGNRAASDRVSTLPESL